MSRIIKLLLPKIINEPTVFDMKEFSIEYSRDEWLILMDNRDFLFFFDKNLKLAKNLAKKILNKV